MGLIDTNTGLRFGDGLIWLDGGLGGEGLTIDAGVPAWVLAAGGVPATLDINFLTNQAYNAPASVSIASLLTCTRATPALASYTNAFGQLIYFAPNTLRCGTNGLLVEEQRINASTNSQTLASKGLVSVTVTSDSFVAPDGTTTADTVTTDATGQARIDDNITPAAATTYAQSMYAHFLTAPFAGFGWFDGSTDHYISWNIQTGAHAVTVGTAYSAPRIEALANGWYRISATLTSVGGGGSSIKWLISNNQNVLNNTVSGFAAYLWGVQSEIGAFATSYIPTTTVAVTRAADVVTIATSAFAYNAAASTVYGEFNVPVLVGGRYFSINDGTLDNRMEVSIGAGAALSYVVVSGGVVGVNTGPANLVTVNVTSKAASAGAANNFAIVLNAGTAATDASGAMPVTPTVFNIGTRDNGANPLNGYLRRISYWDSRVANAALQTLTT